MLDIRYDLSIMCLGEETTSAVNLMARRVVLILKIRGMFWQATKVNYQTEIGYGSNGKSYTLLVRKDRH